MSQTELFQVRAGRPGALCISASLHLCSGTPSSRLPTTVGAVADGLGTLCRCHPLQVVMAAQVDLKQPATGNSSGVTFSAPHVYPSTDQDSTALLSSPSGRSVSICARWEDPARRTVAGRRHGDRNPGSKQAAGCWNNEGPVCMGSVSTQGGVGYPQLVLTSKSHGCSSLNFLVHKIAIILDGC